MGEVGGGEVVDVGPGKRPCDELISWTELRPMAVALPVGVPPTTT